MCSTIQLMCWVFFSSCGILVIFFSWCANFEQNIAEMIDGSCLSASSFVSVSPLLFLMRKTLSCSYRIYVTTNQILMQ